MNNLIPLFLIIIFSCSPLSEDEPEPYIQIGMASYYAKMFEGRPTASGQRYRQDSLTAAHQFLPLGTLVTVINLENHEAVDVLINDRGPFVEGRIIDLSRTAAERLNMIDQGVARVKLKVKEPAPGYSVADSVVREIP